MAGRADLRVVLDLQHARTPDDMEPPLASANSAVPLLWLALFDYADVEVERVDDRRVFFASAPLPQAIARISALPEVLPDEEKRLIGAARTLEHELERLVEDTPSAHVVLFPAELFKQLPRTMTRPYLTQLTQLCDLWERLRKDLTWPEACDHLAQISPDIFKALDAGHTRTVRYFLIGDLADRQVSLADYLVRRGQQESDIKPEALAVGEQGLLLGRFEGTWKLMSSATSEDLRGVWADEDTGFLVGRRGTICSLKKGRCQVMSDIPCEQHLNSVWGLSPKSVVAVGDHGAVLAFGGKSWQTWPVGAETHLLSVWGSTAENICLGGQDSAIYRYDGFTWTRLGLPIEAVVNRIVGDEERVFAFGGSRAGGEIFELTREGWVRDHTLPRGEWLEGGWKGWEQELGVMPTGGKSVMVNGGRGWAGEPILLEQVTAVAGGEEVLAAGTSGKYTAICSRRPEGWVVEAAIIGLRIHDIWVAGNPKPPRLPADPPPPPPGEPPGPGPDERRG